MAAAKSDMTFDRKVKRILRKGLRERGIEHVRIASEPSFGGKMRRFCIVAQDFELLLFSEQQEIVWRILSEALPREELVQITTVLTLTPKEAKGDFS